ncbi:LLM class oxidoreductase [Rubritalea tangerina]|uniref:LLM class oxidoreductase n=1 Tax=Rubritalea tangerina TaxID=430798 RepID=A0ABW4ZCT6_9BACT
MQSDGNGGDFSSINRGYQSVFQYGQLSIGIVVPIEAYPQSAVPTMERHCERVLLVESLGFSAVWLRDVPFNVPSFGDAGQLYDPFVYLGYLAGQTSDIALGVASAVLPLRHPAHVAKAAASADALSGGRLLLGVASGDRPDEYPAVRMDYDDRGKRYRESFQYIRHMSDDRPVFENAYGSVARGLDMLPKPSSGKLPMLVTGGSQQTIDWIAEHADGWMLYPREPEVQKQIVTKWYEQLECVGRGPQPVMQSLYIDLVSKGGEGASAIHLGFRSGIEYLIDHLKKLESSGVNHVALNLRFNQRDVEETVRQIADELLPHFRNST